MKSNKFLKWFFLVITIFIICLGWFVWYVSSISINTELNTAQETVVEDNVTITNVIQAFEYHGYTTQYSFFVEEGEDKYIYVLDENYNEYPKEAYSESAYANMEKDLETNKLYEGYTITSVIPFYSVNQIYYEVTLMDQSSNSVIYAYYDITDGSFKNYTKLGD